MPLPAGLPRYREPASVAKSIRDGLAVFAQQRDPRTGLHFVMDLRGPEK